MKIFFLLILTLISSVIYSQNNCHKNLVLKAKKTIVICDKERSEPPFDVTVYLDSLNCKLEIYGYGQGSKYNFKINNIEKCGKDYMTDIVVYNASLVDIDGEDDNKKYDTQIEFSIVQGKYYLTIEIPQYQGCKLFFELKEKKKKKN